MLSASSTQQQEEMCTDTSVRIPMEDLQILMT